MAVIAGDPADPTAGLVLDRRNARLDRSHGRPADAAFVRGQRPRTRRGALDDAGDHQCWARRASADAAAGLPPATRRRRLDRGAARPRAGRRVRERLSWPEFGDWAALADAGAAPWVGESRARADRRRRLAARRAGRTSSCSPSGATSAAATTPPAPSACPPKTQAKLAEPLGWNAAGRKWRKAAEIETGGGRRCRRRHRCRLLRGSRRQRRDRHDRHRRQGRDRRRSSLRDGPVGDEARQTPGVLPETLDRGPGGRHGHSGGRGSGARRSRGRRPRRPAARAMGHASSAERRITLLIICVRLVYREHVSSGLPEPGHAPVNGHAHGADGHSARPRRRRRRRPPLPDALARSARLVPRRRGHRRVPRAFAGPAVGCRPHADRHRRARRLAVGDPAGRPSRQGIVDVGLEARRDPFGGGQRHLAAGRLRPRHVRGRSGG